MNILQGMMILDKAVAIETVDLSKRFGKDILALDKVSIQIHKGELVGYVGQNGAGKTTTIKVMTTLLKPTSGKVFIEGIDVSKRPKEALRNVGALIEVPGVYDYLTPHEMLTYFGKIYRMKNINGRITEVLDLVKLSEWEHKKLGSFSTGMQRRFGIAKALFHNPGILIMDEPVLGLDPKGMRDVRELVRKLNRGGMTIFISSHLLQELSETVDRVIFIKKGKILETDSIANIKEKVHPDVINVTLMDPVNEGIMAMLRTLSDVGSVEQVNGRNVRLHFSGGPQTIHDILKQAVEMDLKVVSFNPETINLEEYYLRVMGDLEVT
jgi:ABC-2 type transport system ATP-binding protein